LNLFYFVFSTWFQRSKQMISLVIWWYFLWLTQRIYEYRSKVIINLVLKT
jgi:hypothetical protein